MHNGILLAKENNELRAANEKKKQNRTRSKRQVPYEEVADKCTIHLLQLARIVIG